MAKKWPRKPEGSSSLVVVVRLLGQQEIQGHTGPAVQLATPQVGVLGLAGLFKPWLFHSSMSSGIIVARDCCCEPAGGHWQPDSDWPRHSEFALNQDDYS